MLRQLLFYPFDIGIGFINLIDSHYNLNSRCFGMVDGLHSLRHHTVVGGHHQNGNISGISPPHTHGRKCLVPRCI